MRFSVGFGGFYPVEKAKNQLKSGHKCNLTKIGFRWLQSGRAFFAEPFSSAFKSKNPTIYNIIRWFAGSLGEMTDRPSVWCSKHYFFIISNRLIACPSGPNIQTVSVKKHTPWTIRYFRDLAKFSWILHENIIFFSLVFFFAKIWQCLTLCSSQSKRLIIAKCKLKFYVHEVSEKIWKKTAPQVSEKKNHLELSLKKLNTLKPLGQAIRALKILFHFCKFIR